MAIAQVLTPEEIRSARASNPKARERDLAAELGISEGRFTAAWEGQGVTRLSPDLDAIFPRLGEVGELMALTRNEHAVHEKIGTFGAFGGQGRVASVLGPVIDLRIFRAHWVHAFAVEKTDGDAVKRSIQFFDVHGDAVHKIHCRPASDIDAWDRIVADRRWPEGAAAPDFRPRAASPAPKRAPEAADIEELRRRWAEPKDAHAFQAMIGDAGFGRLQAIRAVGEDFAWRLGDDACDAVLTGAAEGEFPLMVFVRNAGCLQIHCGPVRTVRRMGDWINVMDRDFHLHLRTSAIAEAWAIRRPSDGGDVLSVEAYDAEGERIILFNGVSGDETAGRPEWAALVRALTRHPA